MRPNASTVHRVRVTVARERDPLDAVAEVGVAGAHVVDREHHALRVAHLVVDLDAVADAVDDAPHRPVRPGHDDPRRRVRLRRLPAAEELAVGDRAVGHHRVAEGDPGLLGVGEVGAVEGGADQRTHR